MGFNARPQVATFKPYNIAARYALSRKLSLVPSSAQWSKKIRFFLNTGFFPHKHNPIGLNRNFNLLIVVSQLEGICCYPGSTIPDELDAEDIATALGIGDVAVAQPVVTLRPLTLTTEKFVNLQTFDSYSPSTPPKKKKIIEPYRNDLKVFSLYFKNEGIF